MKALSILQPWAWLIVTGRKDIENRTWSTNFRGRIWVHAGKTYSRPTHEEYASDFAETIVLPPFEQIKAQTGAIVGSVEIVDCVRTHPSMWKDADSYGFVLANPEMCEPFPYRGQLGFFEVDVAQVKATAERPGLF